MKLRRYVCICTETSGIEEDAELIKLDAIKFVNGKIQKTFSRYVKTEKEISKEIFCICELDPNYYYENARDRDESLKEFKKFLGKSVIIGYHLSFDLKYITRHIEIKNPLLDLLKVVRKKMRHCPIRKVEKKYHIYEKNECILYSKLLNKLNKGISYKNLEYNIKTKKITTKDEYNKEKSNEKLKLDIDSGYISTSMIQRHLLVGYPKACEIMDELREKQFISTNRDEFSKKYVILDKENTFKHLIPMLNLIKK